MTIFNFSGVEELAKQQVTQLKDDPEYFDKLCAAECRCYFEPYFQKKPKIILDLGCGIGRTSVWLDKVSVWRPKFILADYNGDNPAYGWNPKDGKYNKLYSTHIFCGGNGVLQEDFFLYNLENGIEKLSMPPLWAEDGYVGIDLVISTLAVGFHYPIEQYIDFFHSEICKNTFFIFGLREGKYTKEFLQMLFAGKNIEIHDTKFHKKEQIAIIY